jgi:hypothetical protein
MNRLGLFALAGVTVAALAQPAHAQGYPVIDNMAIAKTSVVASNTSTEVSRLQELINIARALNDAVGLKGPQTGWAAPLTNSSGLAGIGPRLPPIPQANGAMAGQLHQSITANLATGQNPGIAAFRDHSLSALYSTNMSLNTSQQAQYDNTRQIAAREAAISGYATAAHARQDAAAMPERTAALRQQAERAQDVRQDLVAGNAVLLATLERLNTMQAVLANLLELEASRQIATDQTYTYSPSATLPVAKK